jgi:Protein of unknown function (DUF1460)
MTKSISFFKNHQMHLFHKIICIVCLFIAQNGTAQSLKRTVKPVKHDVFTPKTPAHVDIFNEKMKLPVPETTAEGVLLFGKTFLGNAYPKANADTTGRANEVVKLQPIQKEVLVINLKKFDCVTFVESMIALTQTRRSMGLPNYDTYKKNVLNIRYRNGAIDYAARLHYFSDWLFENEKRGVLKNITKYIGGETFPKPVFYMSFKRDTLYGNMADSTTFKAVKAIEETITKREKFYIPKERVTDIESKIKNGDIIAVTNRLDGMDMAHTGFAVWKNGRVYMLHASSKYKKVVMTDVPLADYLMGNKGQTGIMIGRLN